MHNWKSLVRARLGPLPVDAARASDIVDELAQHVAEHYKDLIADGVGDAEAIERALAPLAARAAKEIARADRPRPSAPTPPASTGGGPLTGMLRDLRYAARLLLRTPAFTATAVLTLALGIGASTAIFSVVNAVLLQPLPYADPEHLMLIGERGNDGSASNVGYTTFLDWRARNHSFEDMAIFRSFQTTLVANGEPERVAGMRVSSNFFPMLGVRPALGRTFNTGEDTQATWRQLILSDGLWRRRFNADPGVIGRVLTMNDATFTVIGVMPASFEPLISERFYQRAEMWALLGYDTTLNYACRTCQHLKALGRLRPGVSIDTARAEMDGIHNQLRAEFPADYPQATMAVEPLRDALTGRVRPALAVLMGAVGCVLLIACANVANLLLARMTGRERDLAMRAALGASRARLIRQMLVESALLAVAGGTLGIAIGATALPLLTALAPDAMSRLAGAHLDGRVLGFSMVLSLATAFVFGLLPAIRASRTDLQGSLHGDGRKTSRAPTSLARRLLVAADLALAVVLLVGAGLMIKSVGRLLAVDPGFEPDRVLTLQISMIGRAYREDAAVLAKIEQMLERLRALPGVETAAMAGQIPLGGNGDRWGFHVQGRVAGIEDPSVERYSVTPDYFSVMHIPLKRGRLFTDADRTGAEEVMLIGEQTARTVFPNEDPIGQHVRIGGADTGPWRTIVGIVGDVRHQSMSAQPTIQMYMPMAQLTDSFLTVVVRTRTDPAALATSARQTIWSVAGDVPVYQVATLSDLVAKSVAPRRFVMILLEVFSAVALLMTAIGVYGVISYAVSERTREIGIRSALGANSRDIVRLIVGGGLSVVAAGLAVGVLVALGATDYLDASLYQVGARDPLTFMTVTAILFAVALLAQVIPIARAMRIEPTIALRSE
jgi:putative ABC transport system permease protein